MHVVISAGPTAEPLDEVRRLTNISTGNLGCALARAFTGYGHAVTLLLSATAVGRDHGLPPGRVIGFSDTASLADAFRHLAPAGVDAVLHAAAVSDFCAGAILRRTDAGAIEPVHARKVGTRDGPLLLELVPTPKILPQLRRWFPDAVLVGWKYEVDGARADAVAAGGRQLIECGTDACVINGPAYGSGFGILAAAGALRECAAPDDLASALEDLVRSGSQLQSGRGSRSRSRRA